MTTYVLDRSQIIAAPLDVAFRFFEDPRNLAKITPGWLSFEIVDIDGLPLRAGSQIEYRIKWLGIGSGWRTLIEEFERPHRFVDRQIGGPYRRWRHEHRFEASGGETVMRDRVEYELPYGVVGRIVHRLVVRRQLQQIFDYRAERIREMFGAKPEGDPAG